MDKRETEDKIGRVEANNMLYCMSYTQIQYVKRFPSFCCFFDKLVQVKKRGIWTFTLVSGVGIHTCRWQNMFCSIFPPCSQQIKLDMWLSTSLSSPGEQLHWRATHELVLGHRTGDSPTAEWSTWFEPGAGWHCITHRQTKRDICKCDSWYTKTLKGKRIMRQLYTRWVLNIKFTHS